MVNANTMHMSDHPVTKVVIIGAGHVAYHLAIGFHRIGVQVVQIVNRSKKNGSRLAEKVGARYIPDIRMVDQHADLYLIAVTDAAISLVCEPVFFNQGVLVHTSGSVDMTVLQPFSHHTGVFYPLQTFRNNRKIRWKEIPLCIEGNTPQTIKSLDHLARQLSHQVYTLSSAQRKILHLTAVFAGNFTNFMYSIAEDLLQKNNLPFELVKPLIKQTTRNIHHSGLFHLQTGPAIREEHQVIEEHLKMLAEHENYKEIYDVISKSIIEVKKTHVKL